MSKATTIPRVLYVDDDSDDCLLLSESFAANESNTDIVCASDGEEAINYLNSIQQNNLPSLIILDLNLPKKDGRQTLSYIKSNPQLSRIPVVILSTSDNKADKETCAFLGANSYWEKPVHYEGYKDIVRYCMHLIHE